SSQRPSTLVPGTYSKFPSPDELFPRSSRTPEVDRLGRQGPSPHLVPRSSRTPEVDRQERQGPSPHLVPRPPVPLGRTRRSSGTPVCSPHQGPRGLSPSDPSPVVSRPSRRNRPAAGRGPPDSRGRGPPPRPWPGCCRGTGNAPRKGQRVDRQNKV